VTPGDSGLEPWSPGETLAPREVAAEPAARPGPGQEIVIGGERVPIGAPVVLWTDRGGHDAYASGGFRPGRPAGSGREGAERAVDRLVLHYDVAGTSRRCFDVLSERGLSVHFLLDVDGTLYQTLDVGETAWHARGSNERSVGVEIAQIGAYPPGDPTLGAWYGRDRAGPRLTLPAWAGTGGIRTPGFVGRPARPARVRGRIHDRTLEQYDFTPEQYATLARLTAALVRALPRLPLAVPQGAGSRVRTDALPPGLVDSFRGVVGHYHLTPKKIDPGPAFDWERYLTETRELLGTPEP
jgi:hypothetical protein